MTSPKAPIEPLAPDQRSAADAYVEALAAQGIEYVFSNAGTDFAPVIEALIKARETGSPAPDFVAIPHENVAMAMAHGYARLSGKPAAAMVHTTVGTANALCGLINAARDNIPLFLAAGRTPYTEAGHAGSRGANIHWGQEVFDQGGLVRNVVKWEYELRAGQPAETVVGRALDIAMAEPKGPVYLTLPREVLGDPAAESDTVDTSRPLGGSAPAPDPAAVAEAAEAILEAEFPLLLTSAGGRTPDAFQALGEFAEKCGVAVAQPFATDVNLATDNPMNFGGAWMPLVGKADVIIVLEAAVPWNNRADLRDDVKIIQIAADPFYQSYPLRGFPAHTSITGTAEMTLPLLTDAVTASRAKLSKALDGRRAMFDDLKSGRAERLAAMLKKAETETPIAGAWIAKCLNDVKDKKDVIINELGSPFDAHDFYEPGTYMATSSAGGLGFSLGAALGAKLADKSRNVFSIVGDGSYFFGVPLSAHFAARSLELPTVNIIANNGRWNAVHASTVGMYPDARASKTNKVPLVDLDPSPAFEKVMDAFDGYGEKVVNPADLPGAIDRALKATQKGDPAVLNVETAMNSRPPV